MCLGLTEVGMTKNTRTGLFIVRVMSEEMLSMEVTLPLSGHQGCDGTQAAAQWVSAAPGETGPCPLAEEETAKCLRRSRMRLDEWVAQEGQALAQSCRAENSSAKVRR